MKQQNINDILQTPHNQLASLIAKVNQLQQLNQSLSKILDPKIAAHCTITNHQGTTLTLLVDNSSWGTKIRYMSAQIISSLKNIPELSNIKKINCIVRPNKPRTSKKNEHSTPPLTISEQTKATIKSIADNIENEQLQQALRNLGKSGNQG